MKCVYCLQCPYVEWENKGDTQDIHCKNTDCAIWEEYEGKDDEDETNR